MIMACGTGKTLTTLWIMEALEADRTLVLVPSLSLLAQTFAEWAANATVPFSPLLVCSDPTVRGQDEWVSTVTEIGFPVTTDPIEIAGFLGRRGRRIVFSTYQSSPRIADAYALGRVDRFDLVIADEAHRTAGPDSSDFATILDDDRIRTRKRLFTTATPRVFTGRVKREAEEADLEIASMDDENAYGPVIHRLTFGEAISRDLLSNYQVLIMGVDDTTIAEQIDEGRIVEVEGVDVDDARTLAAHVGLAKAMRRFDLRRTITFHGLKKRAKDFASAFPAILEWMPSDHAPSGRVWARHVAGDMPTNTRTARIKRLKAVESDERGLLSNVRCLAEGVDVPALDAVAFIDPKGSQTVIVQAVGRAIRKADDKTISTIVLPVFIEDDDDPDSILKSSVFRPVWSVLRALRDHDEVLADELDQIRRAMGRRTASVDRPPKILVDVPDRLSEAFVEALNTRIVEATTERWEWWYGMLERWIESTGSAYVPKHADVDGHRLGAWTGTQRDEHQRGTLRVNRFTKLDALRPMGWRWNFYEAAFEEGYQHARKATDTLGTADIAADYVDPDDGYRTGQWVSRVRRQCDRLSAEQIAILENLEGWMWDPLADSWRTGYAHLVEYVDTHGDALVPQRYRSPDGFRLGSWVNNQRNWYRDPDREMPADRVQALNDRRGWSWNPEADRWEDAFALLERFVDREGHARVKQRHDEDGFRLGAWVATQRKAFKSGDLDPGRARRLLDLPGWAWDHHQAVWDEKYEALIRFEGREGHCQVPQRHKDGDVTLGLWVMVQRRERDNMPDDRRNRLEAIRTWTWEATR